MRGLLWIPAVVGCAIVAAALDEDSGIQTWWRLRGDVHEARGRIQVLRLEIEALRRHAEGLEADEFAIERAIRQELDFARRGETVVRLPLDASTSPRIP